ncbi:hypothetical protein [Streptomyces sp.]|uniref:hypothetical protein n=1 Tax=Streptomyces sp. TaxID=1931 RepID=UPI0025D92EDC|nr:hypothetical protein [Streptomyces sp.]
MHQIVAPFGCGNVWKSDDSDLGGVGGYAVNVTGQSRYTADPNVVYSSNTVTRAVTGLSNIAVTAGGRSGRGSRGRPVVRRHGRQRPRSAPRR